MKPTRLQTTLALAAAAIALTLGEARAAASASPPKHFDIGVTRLSSALDEFAKQSDRQIFFSPEVVDDKQTGGFKGDLQPEAVLKILLRGTGLTFRVTPDETILIDNPNKQAVTEEVGPALRLAQSEPGSTDRSKSQGNATDVSLDAAGSGGKAEEEDDTKADKKGIPEVLVKGSHSLNTDIERSRDDAQPYVVFDKGQIERSGASDVGDFLKQKLSMDPAPTLGAQQTSATVGNVSMVNLRGLGPNQTLILIDGRRAGSFALFGTAVQPDLNSIPLDAIEKIEVLPSTASGIYGGGATGGVVNVVLRRDFSGLSVGGTYESPFSKGGATRRFDMTGGLNFEQLHTSLTFVGSYSDSDQLLTGDRDFFVNGRNALLAVNPSAILDAAAPPLGAVTNIRSASGDDLMLKTGVSLNSPLTSVPLGYTGASSDGGQAFLANAGKYNLSLANTAQGAGGRKLSILSGPIVKSLRTSIRTDFTPWLNAFLTGAVSKNASYQWINNASGTFSVPESAPNNPFSEDILVTTPVFGTDQEQISSLQEAALTGGVIVQLMHKWRAEVDYTWDRTTIRSSIPGYILQPSAANDVASGALNVLRDTNAIPVDFSAYSPTPTVISPVQSTLKDATLRIAGPLVPLPSGRPVTLSLAVEHRDDEYAPFVSTSSFFTQTYSSRSQSVDSVYLESTAPLLVAKASRAAQSLLELQVAARLDNYTLRSGSSVLTYPGAAYEDTTYASDHFTAIKPTFALKYQPLEVLMFRGSYAKGFLPPGLGQIIPSPEQQLTLVGLTDPRRGNEPIGQISVLSGGNPNLRPEESQSISFGVVLTPTMLSGLRVSSDWTKIHKENNITTVATFTQQDLLNEADVPGLIVRGATLSGDQYNVGPVIAINDQFINVSKATFEAIDLALDYTMDLPTKGSLALSVAGTDLLHNASQVTTLSPTLENAGTPNFRKWSANGELTWKYLNWSLAWSAQYLDSAWMNQMHEVDQNTGLYTIGSQIYHDVSASYRFASSSEALWSNVLTNLEIRVGVRNIFDTKPRDLGIGNYYDYAGDPRLSLYWVSFRKQISR